MWRVKAGLLTQREIEITRRKKDTIPIVLPGVDTKPEGGKIPKERELKRKFITESINEDSLSKKPKFVHSLDKTKTNTVPTDNRRRSPRLNPHLQTAQKLLSLQTIISNNDEEVNEIISMQSLIGEVGDEMEMWQHPIAYKASTDPDTMYASSDTTTRQKCLVQAKQKEVNDQMDNNTFTIVHKDTVPKEKIILPAGWQMKRKRDVRTQEVKKFKARLNIDGSKMVKGIHYNEAYAPVASWNSIRIMLALVAAYGWHTQQIDYVLAFPQAPVEKEIYMKPPKGFCITTKNPQDNVLKLNRNVYGQKQAGRVWNKYLQKIFIEKVGFKQSKIDECVYYEGRTLYVLYTDDLILAGPD